MQIQKVSPQYLYNFNANAKKQSTNSRFLNNEKMLANSLEALAFLGRFNASKIQPIPPAEFDTVTPFVDSNGNLAFLDYIPVSRPDKRRIKHEFIQKPSVFDKNEYSKFKEGLNPKTLDIIKNDVSALHISNFSAPAGTIAISTDIKKGVISTDNLYQCIGVAFVDKSKGIQTLLHLCPVVNKKDNTDLINYILSHSNSDNLEITVAPGRYDESDITVRYFLDVIKDYKDVKDIKFVNFPDNVNISLVLKKGKLKCCSRSVLERTINPKGKLIHAGNKPVYW